MTVHWNFGGWFVVAGALFGLSGSAHADVPVAAPGVAVVELFTSEGCSSCPPADELLGKLVRDADKTGRAVFPIAWHVDYWDRLGWRDPFSSPDATARQSLYAQAFQTDDVYTPQMIVNGNAGFVGSDEDRAAKEITTALDKPATARVQLTTRIASDHHLTVTYSVDGVPTKSVLNIVAVEQGLSVHVARGENGGRTLVHENVARGFKKISLDSSKKGDVTLTLPENAVVDHMRIIGFVQTLPSMTITGASLAAAGEKASH